MKNKLILASASPRRAQLLKQILITPDQILPPDINEDPQANELPRDLAVRLAKEKAQAIYNQTCLPRESGDLLQKDEKDSRLRGKSSNIFILGADTVVACGRRILPKTETEEEARDCLALLSGRRHHVYGGIALITPSGKIITRLCDTVVQFKKLTAKEIESYIVSGEWKSVAGGYAIQGLAASYIKSIRGDYSNVVGLSLYDTMAMLDGAGFKK